LSLDALHASWICFVLCCIAAVRPVGAVGELVSATAYVAVAAVPCDAAIASSAETGIEKVPKAVVKADVTAILREVVAPGLSVMAVSEGDVDHPAGTFALTMNDVLAQPPPSALVKPNAYVTVVPGAPL
jgi:hypothetical protein